MRDIDDRDYYSRLFSHYLLSPFFTRASPTHYIYTARARRREQMPAPLPASCNRVTSSIILFRHAARRTYRPRRLIFTLLLLIHEALDGRSRIFTAAVAELFIARKRRADAARQGDATRQ